MTPPFYAAGPSGVAPPTSQTPRWPRWGHRLLHALLPAHCLSCAAPLPAGRGAAGPLLGLCAACRGRLRPLPPGSCAVCRRFLPATGLPAGWPCQSCRDEPPAYERLLALWSYAEPLAAVIRALKFRRLDYLGRHLGEHLADRFASELSDLETGIDLIVPVPLHWRRRLHRGYNQAALIAAPLARRLALPVAPLLRRTRATPPQSLLGKPARLANLRRAFRVPHPERLQGRHLLLVDDVATTGATLEAAAAILRKAGAASVIAMTAGRTL
jgi:ComF family protein